MRRLVVEQPAAAAGASRLVAIFAFYVVLISVALLRFGIVDVVPGIAALASGWLVALVALLLALAAFVTIWRWGSPGGGRAFFGLALSALLLLPPAALGARAVLSPRLNDITTDLDRPPMFTVAANERGPGANPIAYDRDNAALQRKAYPNLYPLLADAPPDDVHDLVIALVKERRWRLVVDIPLTMPDSKGRVPVRAPVGRIEAVARSFVLGFEDDIAIRLTEEEGRTRIDMRSASRYGNVDFGVNAARVSSFLEDLRTRALIPDQATQ
jgi:hypothetical protein